MLEGVIVKNISNSYTVRSSKGEYICTPRGRFRLEKRTPLVGDRCMFDPDQLYMYELLPRKNELKRPNVCNIDATLIVTSIKHPDFNSTLLDKEISSVFLSHIEPVLCFTKLDLLTNEELEHWNEIQNYYKNLGFSVFTNQDILSLVDFLKGKVVVLTGQSGAGKSTLLNRISPDLNLRTSEISSALNRGVHTTRHTEIFDAKGISFLDTPGFSSLNLEEYKKEEIRDSFPEFSSVSCQFQDCMHVKERVCGVKAALEEGKILDSRYESYLKMLEECQK